MSDIMKNGKRIVKIGEKAINGRIALKYPAFMKFVYTNYILACVMKAVKDKMKATCAGVWLIDRENKFVPRLVYGIRNDYYSLADNRKFIRILKSTVKKKHPLVIEDLDAIKDVKLKRIFKDEGFKSLIFYPLVTDKTVSGVLVVCRRSRDPVFDENRIMAGNIIAHQAAVEMRDARQHKTHEDDRFDSFDSTGILISMLLKNAKISEKDREATFNTIQALAALIDRKDKYTHNHSRNVMKYCIFICEKLNLDEKEVAKVRQAALLHDIGKLGIDTKILQKKGPLNKKEWAEIKQHPTIGAKIIAEIGLSPEIVKIVRHHHARFEGGGYPNRNIRHSRIPLGARIICVADAFDAMNSNRPYRKALKNKEVLKELERCSGTQFDPEIVEALIG